MKCLAPCEGLQLLPGDSKELRMHFKKKRDRFRYITQTPLRLRTFYGSAWNSLSRPWGGGKKPFCHNTVWNQKEHDILKWNAFFIFYNKKFFFKKIQHHTALLSSFHSWSSVSGFVWLTKRKRIIAAPEAEQRSFSLASNFHTFKCICPPSLRRVWLCAAPWAVDRQTLLSTGFSRQDYWSGLPFPSPGELPDPGIEPAPPALAGGFFTTEPPDKV